MNNADFLKYPHLERFGNVEVEGIEHGTVHVFPKIDGSNGSVWSDGKSVFCASRNRLLTGAASDNQGFREYVENNEVLCKFTRQNPNLILYGEWLVPHTIKHYRDSAWNTFYVFDVFDRLTGQFVHYDLYYDILEANQIPFVPCYSKIQNGSVEHFKKAAKDCRFLLHDDAKYGEGVVLKNYDFVNRFYRTTWAKIVLDEFKEKHVVAMGPQEVGAYTDEQKLADDTVTPVLVNKEYAKILAVTGSFTSQQIPRLLETVTKCVITEELYDWLKKNKKAGPLDFSAVRSHCIRRVKQIKPEIFA